MSSKILEDVCFVDAKNLGDRDAIIGCLLTRVEHYKIVETPDDISLVEEAGKQIDLMSHCKNIDGTVGSGAEIYKYKAVYYISKLQNKGGKK